MSTTKKPNTNFCIFVTSMSIGDVIDCNTVAGMTEHDTLNEKGLTGNFFWYETREQAERAKDQFERELK